MDARPWPMWLVKSRLGECGVEGTDTHETRQMRDQEKRGSDGGDRPFVTL